MSDESRNIEVAFNVLRRERDGYKAKLEASEGLLREWYTEERFERDDCSCDAMKVCDGTCLLQRTRKALDGGGE